jgi:DNA-binding FadR family transcriptional regulator
MDKLHRRLKACSKVGKNICKSDDEELPKTDVLFHIRLYHISANRMLNTSNYYHLIVALMMLFHNKSLFLSLYFYNLYGVTLT